MYNMLRALRFEFEDSKIFHSNLTEVVKLLAKYVNDSRHFYRMIYTT
jgi:hypothetical protein